MGEREPIRASAPVLADRAATRLIVVDDSRLQRRILTKTLLKWGFNVMEAEDAETALELCRVSPPDLIISDWMMPGMSGIEFCEAFRQLSEDHFGYFILLTSKSEKSEIASGLDAGADDFLTKPVDLSELRARITAGERIVRMQRELSEKNRLIGVTLEELRRIHDVLDKDLLEARSLQQALVHDKDRAFPEGRVSLLLRTAGHVGGDLVGFFETDDDKLGLFAIDVSGHGISSALMTARLAGYLSAVSPEQNVALRRREDGRFVSVPPALAVEKLNDLVMTQMNTDQYLTLMMAFVDLPTGKVTLTQAGHPHPLVRRRDGRLEQHGCGGFPVGLVEEMDFGQFDLTLEPGDSLLLFSDGITECPDPSGKMLGEEGLDRLLGRIGPVDGPRFFDRLIWHLAAFAGTEEFPDDISGIQFRYDGPSRTGDTAQE